MSTFPEFYERTDTVEADTIFKEIAGAIVGTDLSRGGYKKDIIAYASGSNPINLSFQVAGEMPFVDGEVPFECQPESVKEKASLHSSMHRLSRAFVNAGFDVESNGNKVTIKLEKTDLEKLSAFRDRILTPSN